MAARRSMARARAARRGKHRYFFKKKTAYEIRPRYWSSDVCSSDLLKVAIRADGDPRALAAAVRQEISRLDSQLAIESLEPMDDQIRDVVAPQRLSTVLVGGFAAIALLLASVGLYGLVAYTTAQRGREMA